MTDEPRSGLSTASACISGCDPESRGNQQPVSHCRAQIEPDRWNQSSGCLGAADQDDRRGLLDAVVFSGGEPTLQPALESALDEVKAIGFEVGLHTAGIYPKRLERLLPKLDWVGLDVKADPERYPMLTGVPGSGARAWHSARLLIESGTPHEMRITMHPAFTDRAQAMGIRDRLQSMGAPCVVVQPARTGNGSLPGPSLSANGRDGRASGRDDDGLCRPRHAAPAHESADPESLRRTA